MARLSNPGGKRAANPMKTLRRLFGYYSCCKVPFTLAVISTVIYSVTVIWASYLLEPTVALLEQQNIVPDRVYAEYMAVLLMMAVLYVLAIITNYLLSRLMLTCSARILFRMRVEMFEHMQRMPVRFFDSHTHGELMSYYTNDVEAVREMLHHGIAQMLISSISLVGIVFMMLKLSPVLCLFIAVMGFCVYMVTRIVGGKSRKNFQKQQKAVATVNGYIEEMIVGQKVVKAFNHEQATMEQFDVINEELRTVSTRALFYAKIIGPVMNNLSHIFYAIITTAGVLMLTAGSALMTFLQYIRQFADRISQISQQFSSIMLALAGAERVFEMIDSPVEEDEGDVTLVHADIAADGTVAESDVPTGRWAWRVPAEDGGCTYTEVKGDIRLSDVDFGYTEEKQVLHDVSLYAKPGQKIAFVGSTGAGKTTITNLINRFYDINSGTITYDGIDLRRIKKSELRRSLGMVLQDTHLFTGTVMENIRYGRLDATDEECIAAAKTANAHYFISHLPKGYDTMLTSDGANLSQGQRQLISIARAAVSDPPVLILDEATSSIDTRTEKLIEQGMDRLMSGRTVFVIAHRLSTVRNSNAIMVLEQGRIIERGDHDDLLREQGKYYQLYTGMFELS